MAERLALRLRGASHPDLGSPFDAGTSPATAPTPRDHASAAFDLAPDPLLVLDDERRCLEANRAACELVGLDRGGLVGQRFDAFAPIEWRERITSAWPDFLHEGSATGDIATTVPGGARALLEFTVRARVAGGAHLLTLRDVTAARAAVAAQRSLSAALDRTGDAVVLCSHDGIVQSWNRAAEQLYGHTAEEATGCNISLIVPATEEAARREAWDRALCGGPPEPYQAMRRAKDGRSVVVNATATAFTDEFGTAVGVVEIARDVTEANYAHAALSPSQARAVESSQAHSQFLASMSHELRVPLSSVIGVTRLLEETGLDDRQREYVHGLRVSGEALALAIQAVLDFSKLETGTLELADEPFDVRSLIDDVCSVVALGAPSELDVLAHVAPDVPDLIEGDEQRVRQVLAIMAASAVKLTPAGEVCVTASTTTMDGARHLLVEVRGGRAGTGGELVFDSFTTPKDQVARGGDASAFGGTIARRLVAMMGGEFGVDDSDEGRGFTFTMPLRGDAAAPAARCALDVGPVLLVHSRAAGRELLARQLEDHGAHVASAADHDGALAALRAAADTDEPFALAVIDHRDGRTSLLDAVALAGAIRADPMLRDTRTALIVAARDARSIPASSLADMLITKPTGHARLAEDIARALADPPSDPRGPAAPAEEPEVPGSFGRVMVAEDNPVNQMVAVHLLEQRGFVVDVANDGREAIVLHAHNQYDAIFMDCQMPVINGYEATREIRRREGTKRHTPIIAMTASTLPSDRARCIAEGMDHHTGKPVRPAALDQIIARVISTGATRSQPAAP